MGIGSELLSNLQRILLTSSNSTIKIILNYTRSNLIPFFLKNGYKITNILKSDSHHELDRLELSKEL